MNEEARWETPTLSAYRNGSHKSPKDTRDFLQFRLEEWMLKPALFLMGSQPEIPGHLCSLILLAISMRQAAQWAGMPVGEAVEYYGTWSRSDHIKKDFEDNAVCLAYENRMHGRTEYCSDESMASSNFRRLGPLVFHTLRFADEMAHIARACVADIPFPRLRTLDRDLNEVKS